MAMQSHSVSLQLRVAINPDSHRYLVQVPRNYRRHATLPLTMTNEFWLFRFAIQRDHNDQWHHYNIRRNRDRQSPGNQHPTITACCCTSCLVWIPQGYCCGIVPLKCCSTDRRSLEFFLSKHWMTRKSTRDWSTPLQSMKEDFQSTNCWTLQWT